MKTTSYPRPRLVCRLARSSHVLFDGTGSGHFARCQDCQAALRAAEQLELELRRDAAAIRHSAPEPSTGLERSILRAVREAKVSPPPRPSWSLAWAAGAVAAAVVVTGIFIQRTSTLSPSPGATPAEAVAIIDAVGDLSTEFTQTLIPSAGAIVANNPLQQELGSVYSDARSALDFLALNFLPPASAAPTSKSESAI